ncbi:ABC transporter substrate-binding protein [Pseudomonas fluorescens]|jgi:sulfonate transport system substrate-binding protein|uniref:ABC transporter substrate-binding protein n=1 Tax=Pseudomonas fluorescens TaxID=294 RepID=UPI0020C424A9|nr:PhnD/SsuA/transferrin family substrate-binding protein [Pseudomonas fluorescens]UTL93711.1 ABC transporter substrate-binding protein [Pseudomonas fluorescens]
MNTPWRHALALLGGLFLSLAALAAEPPAAVRIAIVAFTQGGAPVFGGIPGRVIEEGWLEQQLAARGVKLQWTALPHAGAGPQINEGFSNNSLDFAVRGDLPSVIAGAGQVPGKLVVPGGSGNNIYLVVPADSPVHDIQALKGKRLALHRGRPWEFAFSNYLASQGLKLSDFKIANLNPQVGAAAVSAGKVDAAVLLNEAYALEDKGVARILWSTKQGADDWRLVSDLWGTDAFITQYPELTQLVATAWVRAAWWISQEQNRDGYYALSSRAGVAESVLRRDDQDDPVAWKTRWAPKSDEQLKAHYHALAQYALDNRLIRAPYDISQDLATGFTRQALIDLQLTHYWPSLDAQLSQQP